MKNRKWWYWACWIGGCEAVGIVSALLSAEGMQNFTAEVVQPPLAPPGWVFAAAWTVLYALMGIGAGILYTSPASKAAKAGLNLFFAQLIVNFFWSPIFFNLRRYVLASVWLVLLWILVLLMILHYRKVSQKAAWLQIPYQIWLCFAAYLCFGVCILN